MSLGPLWLSVQLAAVTMLLLLVIATPLGWWLAKSKSKLRPAVQAIVALPIVLPPTVLGFYLLILLGPAGAIGGWWLSLTGNALTFSFAGLVIASCVYSLPFAVQPIMSALSPCQQVSSKLPGHWAQARATRSSPSHYRSRCAAT